MSVNREISFLEIASASTFSDTESSKRIADPYLFMEFVRICNLYTYINSYLSRLFHGFRIGHLTEAFTIRYVTGAQQVLWEPIAESIENFLFLLMNIVNTTADDHGYTDSFSSNKH